MLRVKHFSRNEAIKTIKQIDPRLIVGIATSSCHEKAEVVMVMLERLLPVSEKVTIPLPQGFSEHTKIKSVQQILTSEVGHAAIIEIVGDVNALAKKIAEQITLRMSGMSINHCFFPAYADKPSNPLICYDFNHKFLPMNAAAENIRIAHMHALFFVHNKREIHQISFRHAPNKNWLNYSQLLFRSNEDITFLGRLKNIFLPITMKNGRAYFLNIFTGALESQMKNSEIDAFIGEIIGKNTVGAITKDSDLVLCPH